MSYQVLARKWRPKLFSEMVGQEHVLRALINALDNNRLHHAFLFTGTRGVGKTTIARILAKSLNCEKGISSKPCGECSTCAEIDDGRFVDLIEVDAASRTKVEDTRDLLENVQYAPTKGSYKVYLIDEVHMLSTHSFNALLKTLEEPPPHVKFLLATTDPQKLPVTILSRCLQFNLKRLPIALILGHIEHILMAEKITYEKNALMHIAHAADGSMRDALSLLDQAIAFGGGELTDSDIRSMLGTIDNQYVHSILAALAENNGELVLNCVELASEQAPDFSSVLDELLSVLHRIALAQVVPGALDEFDADRDIIQELATKMSAEDVQLFYQIGLMGRRDLALSHDPRSGLEMTLLRMLAFKPVQSEADAERVRVSNRSNLKHTQTNVSRKPKPPVAKKTESSGHGADEHLARDWDSIVDSLKINGMLRELAVNCVLESRSDKTVVLVLDGAHAHLHNKKIEQRLEEVLSAFFDGQIKLTIKIGETAKETPAEKKARVAAEKKQKAINEINEDPNIRILQETFNAQVIKDSIHSIE